MQLWSWREREQARVSRGFCVPQLGREVISQRDHDPMWPQGTETQVGRQVRQGRADGSLPLTDAETEAQQGKPLAQSHTVVL